MVRLELVGGSFLLFRLFARPIAFRLPVGRAMSVDVHWRWDLDHDGTSARRWSAHSIGRFAESALTLSSQGCRPS